MIYIHVYMLYLIYVGETDLMMGQKTLHRGSRSAFKIFFFAFLFLLFPGFLVLVLREEMLQRKTKEEGIKMAKLEETETKKEQEE